MNEVKLNMNKVAEALSKMTDESHTRDTKFEELIKRINEDMRNRELKTEKRIEGLEKHIDTKIEEEFADLETRISAVEKNGSETNGKTCRDGNTKDNPRTVPVEYKAVAHGFKVDSEEKDVRTVIEESVKATGMKEITYTIDCPANPITHAFVEFQNMKIRDRYVRSASMRKVELNGRTIKISPFLDAEERFHRKKLGFVKCMIHKIKGIALHYIHMSYEKKSITIDGQVIAKIDTSGKLKYNRYEDVDEEVQILMTRWLTKNSLPRL